MLTTVRANDYELISLDATGLRTQGFDPEAVWAEAKRSGSPLFVREFKGLPGGSRFEVDLDHLEAVCREFPDIRRAIGGAR